MMNSENEILLRPICKKKELYMNTTRQYCVVVCSNNEQKKNENKRMEKNLIAFDFCVYQRRTENRESKKKRIAQ